MHPDDAIWLIGGLRPELRSISREREQAHTLRASRRQDHVSLIDRLRGMTRPKSAETDLVCCPA